MRHIVTLSAALFAFALNASPQLESLKDDWAAEKYALPQTRAEWEIWRTEEIAPLRTQVDRAAAMKPFLVTRFHEGANTNAVVVAIGGSCEPLDSIWMSQGQHFALMGYSVLMVENPPDDIARICLERGTSWLAYGTAALLPEIAKLRARYGAIIWSSFSLGTELMMSTATLDNAPNDRFIYNDFLCRSKERLIVMDHEPNGLRNLTPGYFIARDFPERMLALSDHKILFTEGGLDRDFRVVSSVFPENVTCYHQPRFERGERFRGDALPRHLSSLAYFSYCNVDPLNHYYKIDLVKAWLKE